MPPAAVVIGALRVNSLIFLSSQSYILNKRNKQDFNIFKFFFFLKRSKDEPGCGIINS